MVIPEDFRRCVAVLYTQHMDSGSGVVSLVPRGTAFFITYPASGISDQQFVYLVTAKHNILKAQEVADRLHIRINTMDGSASYVHTPLRDDNPFVLHPDPTADLAVVPFAPDPSKFDYRAIDVLQFATTEALQREHPPIGPGDKVFFVGLFPQHAGNLRNYPIVRFGQISLLPEERIQTDLGLTEAILVECEAQPGNSGSPVFLYFAPDRVPGQLAVGGFRFSLLGTLQGHFPLPLVVADNVGPVGKVEVNTGIAVVTPAWRLRELLDDPDLKTNRRQQEDTILRERAERERQAADVPQSSKS